eukprot:Filipodium_phascolosomae@DN717_c0_g1_i1.p1
MTASETGAIRSATSSGIMQGEEADLEVSFTPKGSFSGSVYVQSDHWMHNDDSSTGSVVTIAGTRHVDAAFTSTSTGVVLLLTGLTMTADVKMTITLTKLSPLASAPWNGTRWKVALCSENSANNCDYTGALLVPENGKNIKSVGLFAGAGVVKSLTVAAIASGPNEAGASSTWTVTLGGVSQPAGEANTFLHVTIPDGSGWALDGSEAISGPIIASASSSPATMTAAIPVVGTNILLKVTNPDPYPDRISNLWTIFVANSAAGEIRKLVDAGGVPVLGRFRPPTSTATTSPASMLGVLRYPSRPDLLDPLRIFWYCTNEGTIAAENAVLKFYMPKLTSFKLAASALGGNMGAASLAKMEGGELVKVENLTDVTEFYVTGAQVEGNTKYLLSLSILKPQYSPNTFATMDIDLMDKADNLNIVGQTESSLIGVLLSSEANALSFVSAGVASKTPEAETTVTIRLTPRNVYTKIVEYTFESGLMGGAYIPNAHYTDISKQGSYHDKISAVMYSDEHSRSLSCFSRVVSDAVAVWSTCDSFVPENEQADAKAYTVQMQRMETEDHPAGQEIQFVVPIVNPSEANIKAGFGMMVVSMRTSEGAFYSFDLDPYNAAIFGGMNTATRIVLLVAMSAVVLFT